jgi:hypothetical protein
MALDIDKVNWATMKSFVDSRGLSIQVLAKPEEYILVAIDSVFKIQHNMDRTPSDTTNLTDFETNYLPVANGQIGLETFTADRKLRVTNIAENNAPAGIESADNKYRVVSYWKGITGNSIVLDPLATPVTWTTIFSVTNIGKFFSFKAVFNTDDLIIRFTIDGVTIFEINGHTIEDLSFDNELSSAYYPEIFWDKSIDKTLVFNPKTTSILYGSNFKLEAHADANDINRKLYAYTYSCTEEA